MVVVVEGQTVLKVDAHTHILPADIPEEFSEVPLRLIHYEQESYTGTSGPFIARLEYKDDGRLFRELKANCFDADRILEECDGCGVDVQVICTVPVMFNYQLPASAGVPWAKFINDDLARTVARRPDRLAALGTLPLQEPHPRTLLM
jgi:aminocarboxymuconate-semialdehyde decarboxylase